MKLALMSDLHMEFWEDIPRFINNIVDLTPNADVIALAGDIGNLSCNFDDIRDLLVKLSGKGRVICVSGNHEYYGRPFECGDGALNTLRKEVGQYKNIHVNTGAPEWIKVDNINFLVGTLWFANGMFNAFEKSCLSDFKVKGLESYIYHYNEFYKNILEQTCKPNIVTITHHSPTFKSVNEKYKNSSLNMFFCNELSHLLENKGVLLSCHGHLHDPVDYYINKTRVCSAPYGYPSEAKSSWKPLVIDL